MADVRYLVTPMPAGPGSGSAALPVRWRLLGRNHRELGRSAHLFIDPAACRGAVFALKCRLDHARTVVVGDATGRWSWRLHVDGVPVAVGGRSYVRQRECLDNLNQFLAAVRSAGFADGSASRRTEPAGRSA